MTFANEKYTNKEIEAIKANERDLTLYYQELDNQALIDSIDQHNKEIALRNKKY